MANGGDYLKSPDLLPVTHQQRNIGTFGFAVIWVGMAIVLAAFAIGGSGYYEFVIADGNFSDNDRFCFNRRIYDVNR